MPTSGFRKTIPLALLPGEGREGIIPMANGGQGQPSWRSAQPSLYLQSSHFVYNNYRVNFRILKARKLGVDLRVPKIASK